MIRNADDGDEVNGDRSDCYGGDKGADEVNMPDIPPGTCCGPSLCTPRSWKW